VTAPAVRLPAPEDARRGALAQWALIADAVDGLPDAAFGRPTRLGTWTVAELVAHLESNVDALPRALAKPEPSDPPRDVLDYLSAMRDYAPGVAQRAVELTEGATPDGLRARLRAATDAGTAALDGVPTTRALLVRLGAVRLGSFLVTRCVEGVVHGLDLRAATGVPAAPDPTALAVVVRVFAALLVGTAPGRSVEVRVPGHVAVQCVEGPRHTRGTPPNVVEATAEAFVEVCAGRRTWADAVATGDLRASGERADLTPYLPLIG
jgi:uncharacterized protein (TIGR03083 family)